MNVRQHLLLIPLGLLLSTVAYAGPAAEAQAGRASDTGQALPTPAETPRGIRRDMPMTRAIQRAHAAGTRDRSGLPGPNYWQLETDFTIHASLDPATQTITGSESIAVHNNSPSELTQLVLRLDHNIFRADVPRGSSVPAEITDGMVVTRIALDGEEIDLAPQGRGRGRGAARRTSVRGLTRTSATISLASPIAAGATAILEIDWTTKLPGGNSGRGHRMTQRWGDTLFQPTQWYPRLAKYDDLRGWDTSEYLGPAEFYNNFGRFDVTLEVPANWLVSATGVLQNPEEVLTATARERLAQVLESDAEIMIVTPEEVAAGTATTAGTTKGAGDRLAWHYVADRVNDFAWATSANYVWRATRATIPGAGPIPIHMLYLPERANRFERAGSITRHALEFYSELWMPYAFPQLTLQDGPSAGMEYPMVINSNQGAADHEAAHQWWPMMVGTNETWYGWMDEGLNEYMNILSGAHRAGVPPRLDGRGQSYGRMSGNESEPTMMWVSNYGGPMYGFQTYSKAPMMLSMLGGMFGDEVVQTAIRKYAEAWMFKHPSPWDFAFFMNRELGEDLGWFWYSWLYTTDAVDGSIESVRASADRVVVTVRQAGAMPAPVVLAIELEGEDESLVKTWPVDVWFDGRRTFAAEVELDGRTVRRVTLDPHGRFPDHDPADNVWTRGE